MVAAVVARRYARAVERRPLGRSGLAVSVIGCGSWAAGGSSWEVSLGPQDDDESVAAIVRSIELGVDWIDTAPAYGVGHSEEVVGRALRALAVRPLVSTKCGFRWDEDRALRSDLSEASIREEVEASLTRLGIDAIDLYQIHWPRPPEQLESAWRVLAALRREGLVRAIGLSNVDLDQLRRCHEIEPVDSVQVHYSLIERTCEDDLLPFLVEHGVGGLAYSPLGMGLLSSSMSADRIARMAPDDWRLTHAFFLEPARSRNLARAAALQAFAHARGHAAEEVALAWVLRHPAISSAISGFRRPAQVDATCRAVDVSLSDADAAELNAMA
jgi:aryl-alcohol dehydrogenase-like predicted oxidoreductase